MNTSESIKEIATAMIEVQKEVKGLVPDKTNPHFKNDYITLDGILEFVRPILAKNNIWLMQNASSNTESITVITKLVHISGEFIETDAMNMQPVRIDPQGLGSCLTYAKRYQLASLLGISSEVDEDGNNASKGKAKQPAPVPTKPEVTSSLTEAQIKRLFALSKAIGFSEADFKQSLEQYCKVTSVKALTKSQYDNLCAVFEERAKEKK